MSVCKHCKERGQTWAGDPPRCAFDNEAGVFSGDNWNCATMNRLRDVAEDDAECLNGWLCRDDLCSGSFAVVHIPEESGCDGGYLAMSFYKNRGRTGDALIMDDGTRSELTKDEAEKLVDYFKGAKP